MRLKKLELFGFKSFADRTEVIFDEGVTCVVGPNGCGKSNISDSIRWVLGERSAKILRGSKMEDVIFNGTDFRKPAAISEVSLTIDNADRGLPIDYNEVTITRRLYRSGESEYFLNKTLCRLKDIQDIILDTGIGSNSYSMIEQGRIDYILNADADERRFLIEEAAGISKFKVKKEEAIRKLEKTEENRLRLNDIIQEVQKNIQYAERQAKRAERYKLELEKLKSLELTRSFWDLGRIQSEKQTLAENRRHVEQRRNEIGEKSAESRKAQDELTAQLRTVEEGFRTEESRRYGLSSKLEQFEQQLQFNQEKRMEMAARRGQIQQEQASLQERIEKAARDLQIKTAELAQIADENKTLTEGWETAQKNLQDIEARIQQARSELERLKQEVFTTAADSAARRNDLHRVTVFIETALEQKRRHETLKNRLSAERQEWQIRQEATTREYQACQEKFSGFEISKAQLDQDRRQIDSLVEEHKLTLEQIRRELHEDQTRLAMLLEIDHASREGEEAIFAEVSETERSLTKNLRQIFNVDEGYEWALEAALESFSRSLVAEDLKTAAALLRTMRRKKPLPMGILIRQNPAESGTVNSQPQHPMIRCALKDRVRIESGYENVFGSFFENVYVLDQAAEAEHLESLLPLAQHNRFISPDGLVIGPHSRLFFHDGRLSAEHNLFKRGADITRLKESVAQLEESLGHQTRELSIGQERLRQIAANEETVESGHLDAAIQKESFESLLRGMDERLGALNREIELAEMDVREVESQCREAEERRIELEKQVTAAESAERTQRQLQDEESRRLETLNHERTAAVQKSADQKAQLDNLSSRSRFLEESLRLLVEHETRDRHRIELLSAELLQMAQRELDLRRSEEEMAAKQADINRELRESEIALELIRQQREGIQAQIDNLRAALESLIKEEQGLQGQLHQFDMQDMNFDYEARNIGERLEQTYRIQLANFRAEDYPIGEQNPEELVQKIEQLREKVESLGTVNLLAIEEYDELKKRYDFLMAQQKDLEDAREQLLETIRKINRTTKSLFETTFERVQTTFQEYYQTLFRGGTAKLVLVDETNPLESGIDIHVRPPGKRLQHISLLSGGEKALTAIALLFALFKIKPSPFCVLDEVDAPLDEANIDRFLTVLRTFLQTSQFIIVTHNRKTIAMGDSLYGVTMQEAGISKIVSVKVNPNGGAITGPAAKADEKAPAETPVSA